MNKKVSIIRGEILLEKLVIIDGLPGNGKSLFGMSILPALERVELYSYSEMLESICALNYLNKMDIDTASEMVKLIVDRKLYDHMMSRKVNFRPTDLSSIFNYPNPQKYINRLFEEGDASIVAKVNKLNPILNIQTHNILPFSKPIWKGLANKVFLLEIVRHPAFMFKQIYTSVAGDLVNNVRNWTLQIDSEYGIFPFNVYGHEELFANANQHERAVIFMHDLHERSTLFKSKNKEIMTNYMCISFEKFVINPTPFIDKLCSWLDTKPTDAIDEVFSKAGIPRSKVTDMPDMEVYKVCGGWSRSIDNYSDRDEVDMRISMVKENVSPDIFDMFMFLCKDYEDKVWKPL
jgi:hypothetical protein